MTSEDALVVVTTSYPQRGDGSESAGSFVRDLVDTLAKRVRVSVVAPGHADSIEEQAGNVRVFRFEAPDAPLSTLKPWRVSDLLAIVRVMRGGERATRSAAADCRATHILACWALPSGFWAHRFSRKNGVDYSVWTLGSDIWTLGRLPGVRSVLKRVLAGARHCYSDGIGLAADTGRLAGLREIAFLPSTRRIECVRGTPVLEHPPYRLLFIGRWHVNKGIDLLLEALGCLADADWDRVASVEIYGGGPLEVTVRAKAGELRARGRPVVAHGFVDKENAQRAFLGADFVLIPSRIESIPVVFSDAMKLGCPVISMPVGDLPELLRSEPRCGIAAAAIDAVSLRDAISTALSLGPSTFRDGVAQMAARFDIDGISDRIISDLFG